MIVRTPGTVEIFFEIQKLRSVSRLLLHLVIDFIAIGESVHQFGVDRFFPQIRSRIHDGLEFLRRDLACQANSILDLAEPRVHQRRHCFFVRRRVLGFRKGVQRVLVFIAVVAVESHAQLGKRALDEGRLEHDPRQPDIPRGLQVDLVKRGRQVVRAVAGTELAESFRVGNGKLLVRPETLDSVANLLHLSQPHGRSADLRDHAHDPVIVGAAIDRVHRVAQGVPVGQHQLRAWALRDVFHQRLFEIGFQNGLRRHLALRPHQSEQHDSKAD